LYDQLKKGVNK